MSSVKLQSRLTGRVSSTLQERIHARVYCRLSISSLHNSLNVNLQKVQILEGANPSAVGNRWLFGCNSHWEDMMELHFRAARTQSDLRVRCINWIANRCEVLRTGMHRWRKSMNRFRAVRSRSNGRHLFQVTEVRRERRSQKTG